MIALLFALSAQAFDYPALKALIVDRKVESVAQLLPLLPESYRKRFVLVYKSRGTEAEWASFKTPRVISHGMPRLEAGDRAVLAFSGNPESPSFNHVEVLDFRENGEMFFHDVELGGREPVFRENPSSCLGCHGSPARPLWDIGPIWPGVYGSYRGLPPAKGQEGGELNAFLASGAKSGHYAAFDMSDYREAARLRSDPQNRSWSDIPMDLEQVLKAMNGAKIVHDLNHSPEIDRYRWFLYGASRDCVERRGPPAEAWIAPNVRAGWKLAPEALLADTQRLFRDYELARHAREVEANGDFWAPWGPGNPEPDPDMNSRNQVDRLRVLAKYRYVLENRGVPIGTWGLADGLPFEGPPWGTFETVDSALSSALFGPISDSAAYRQALAERRECAFLHGKSLGGGMPISP